MADPTWGELTAQLTACAVMLEKQRLAVITQSNNYVGLHDAAGQAQEGDYPVGPAINAHRALMVAPIADSAARGLLKPTLQNIAKLINSPRDPEDLDGILVDLYDYMQSIAVAATGTLTIDTQPADADTIEMGSVTYTFKDTIASANHVFRGADKAAAKQNLIHAILGTGTPGTHYFLGTASPHPDVKCPTSWTGDTLLITAREKGTAGNALASVITATGSNAFAASTLGTPDTDGVQPYSLKTRAFSLGAVSAASTNAYNGTVARCSVTKDGHTIEAGWADTVTVECVGNGYGANGVQAARFEIRGRNPGIDRGVERGAAALDSQSPLVTTAVERFGSPYLVDPFFSLLTSASGADAEALTAAPSGWTVTTGTYTNWKVSAGTPGTNYYRDAPGRTMKALDMYETFDIYARLRGTMPNVPHVRRLIFKRENSATGTLRVRIGSLVKQVSVASTTNDQFGFVDLAMTSAICDRYAWPSEVNEYDTTAKGVICRIDWVRGAGNIILCEFLFQPMVRHDSQYYLPIPNSATTHAPARAAADGRDGDSFTFTNTETGAINQRWIHRGFRATLPTAASPSVADGTVS